MGRYSRNGIRFKIPKNLKGLGNMMASGKEYGAYANEVLAKQMKPRYSQRLETLRSEKILLILYMELLLPNFYKSTYAD
jgi:proline iminopeptidase